MSGEHPKLLPAVVVPTGGWTMKVYWSNAAQFDTASTFTIAAGKYYMADDFQADDFIRQIASGLSVGWNDDGPGGADYMVHVWIDSDHKVNISFMDGAFTGTNRDVRIAWTENDGADIGKVLGFDVSADLDLTGTDTPKTTADHQHGYGWYADEDGILQFLQHELAYDDTITQTLGPAGHSVGSYLGSVMRDMLRLQFVPRAYMYSGEIDYGAEPIWPRSSLEVAYVQNRGFECAWRKIRDGRPFRIYRDARRASNNAADTGTATGSTATTLTDSGAAWNNAPDRWTGRTLQIDDWGSSGDPAYWYISSNTATVLTMVAGRPTNNATAPGTVAYTIFDHPYETYVIDSQKKKQFKPEESAQGLERYTFDLPVVRYET